MGGLGSSRWGLYSQHKRMTVEECLSLDINALVRGERAVAEYLLTPTPYGPSALLSHAATSRSHPRLQWIRLTTSHPHFGGERWWFICPCGQRVGKLYLPPGGRSFKCRHCYNLTYRSAQQANKEQARYKLLARHDPQGLLRALAEARLAAAGINPCDGCRNMPPKKRGA